jgi:hypothetical protein
MASLEEDSYSASYGDRSSLVPTVETKNFSPPKVKPKPKKNSFALRDLIDSKKHFFMFQGSPSQYVKLNVGGNLFYTTIGTLTKHDNMLRAMFSGRMEVITDPDGWILIGMSNKSGKRNWFKENVKLLLLINYQWFFCVVLKKLNGIIDQNSRNFPLSVVRNILSKLREISK